MIDRRDFLKYGAVLGGGCSLLPRLFSSEDVQVPSYLEAYRETYAENPKEAAIQYFRDAKFGLFIHYGVYSLMRRGEWVQFDDKIRVKEYAKLLDRFTAKNFDADFITDMALRAVSNDVLTA